MDETQKPCNVCDELTSWELLNYILVGLVGELNVIGAKDELKLKTFQLWAEFLRKNEVAFFKTKVPSLPKLSASFKAKDAKILYNHNMPKRKKRKYDASSIDSSITWKRQKRNYAKSEYEKSISEAETSLVTLLSSSQTSITSTVSRGIKLNLKDSARKLIKKSVHKEHLKKHEDDFQKLMDCKCIPIKKSTVYYEQRRDELFNRRTTFSLLYIALNLSNNIIQLFDLVRFMKEGNLSSRKFAHFFPENIRKSCEIQLSRYDFPKNFDQSSMSIRKQSAVICNFLSITKLNTPDIISLVTRFCKDFVLPNEIVSYVSRLITYFPPKMEYIHDTTPFYEGRALAYIIFVMKLLFGLDDVKEEKISDSAQNVNNILKEANKGERVFVWKEWMKYIEIRKLILSRYNLCYFESNKDFKNLDANLNKMVEEYLECDGEEINLNRANVFNMNKIFNTFLKDARRVQPHSSIKIITFTPQIDYFEQILYDPPEDILIPEFLKYQHSLTQIEPFFNPKKLKQTLKQENIKMKIVKEKGNEKIYFVQTFSYKSNLPKDSSISLRNIKNKSGTEKNQNETIVNQDYVKIFDTDFLRPIKNKMSTKQNSKQKGTKNKTISNDKNRKFEPRTFKYYHLLNRSVVSSENSILSDVSDNSAPSDNDDEENNLNKYLQFSISDMRYWILHGKLDIKEDDFKNIKTHMPRNFLWLLETFASYLEADLESLYHELLVIENYYFYKLDDPDRIKNIILFKNPEEKLQGSHYSDYFGKFW
ncbi:TATA box-binding protein-associated factor RNA polymerase I subunit B isoform X2 [Condylostylus longicornis]|uniref:TATA box-binding protein-associated factor RNA polymerase I subunit B isoform X2 n=1 Tax=Condylostylus longicornis TaxID=2530218 RepID=UPI00244E0A93|nr:TATA box-binding protein-associated factor RNA polymerase I subunit B isoform X2 [Condylostylus longicornis]